MNFDNGIDVVRVLLDEGTTQYMVPQEAPAGYTTEHWRRMSFDYEGPGYKFNDEVTRVAWYELSARAKAKLLASALEATMRMAGLEPEWLFGPCEGFGERAPIELVASGETERILEALSRVI